MSGDVWSASEAAHGAGDRPTPVGVLFEATIADLRESIGAHLLAGLGYAIVYMPLVILAVLVAYGAGFAGMLWTMRTYGDDYAGIGLLGAMAATLGIVALPLGLVLPPLTASLYRAIHAWQVRGEPLTLGAAFATATQDLGTVYLTTALVGAVVGAGTLLCFVPGVVAGFLLHFTYARAVLHRRSPFEAMRDSWAHVAVHPSWNLGVYGVAVLTSIIVSYVPLVGALAAIVLVAAWNIRAFRAAFPEEVPGA